MATRSGKSPRNHIASPHKRIDMDDEDLLKHDALKDHSFVLLGTAVDEHGAAMTPSAPPLPADMDASAPPMLESPHSAVVFLQPFATTSSGGAPHANARAPWAVPRQKPANLRMGEWEIGFCCCHRVCMPTCLMSTLCPCVSLAQVAGRLGLVSYWYALAFFVSLNIAQFVLGAVSFSEIPLGLMQGATARDSSGDAGNSAAFVASTALGALNMLATWQLRIKIRERFQIPGSACDDYCAACCSCWFFCTCCAVSQMAAHVRVYKPGTFEFGPVDVLPPYECASPQDTNDKNPRVVAAMPQDGRH